MRKLHLILIVLTLFTASCTITQDYHFNNDFSGRATTKIDLSQMLQFMSGQDSAGALGETDTMDRAFVEVAEKYKNLGAKNVKYGWNEDSTVLYMQYDFDNVDVLNKILASSNANPLLADKSETTEKAKFRVKGKRTLYYDAPELAKDTSVDMSKMEAMKDYYQYKMTFSFDRDIKKVKNKNAVVSPDGKSFEFAGSITDIMSSDFDTDFKVKLK